jgi:hypothetical protein
MPEGLAMETPAAPAGWLYVPCIGTNGGIAPESPQKLLHLDPQKAGAIYVYLLAAYPLEIYLSKLLSQVRV